MSSVATEQRRVTHTYTSPEVTVVVVTNVPATVILRDEAEDAIHFDMDTALLLDEKIRAALLRDRTPGVVHNVPWEAPATRPPADFEVRVYGTGVP